MNRDLICTVLSSLQKQRKPNRPIPECVEIYLGFLNTLECECEEPNESGTAYQRISNRDRLKSPQLVVNAYVMITSNTLNFGLLCQLTSKPL